MRAATAGELELLWASVHAVADLPRKIEGRGRHGHRRRARGLRANRRALLQAGVQRRELRPSGGALIELLRHGMFGTSQASRYAKTFSSDVGAVLVGSLDLGPRSLSLDTEIGPAVESPGLAAALGRDFELLLGQALGYRLALEPHGDGTRIVWHGEEGGRAFEHHVEPDRGWWERSAVLAPERG